MSAKLQLRFVTTNGEKNFTFSRVDPNVTTQQVKTLMNAMITNGSIYKYAPLSQVSAKTIITQEVNHDLTP